MKARNRVLKAISHEEPDRIPIDFGGPMTTIEAQGYDHLKEHLKIGTPTEVFSRAHVKPDEQLLKIFSVDTRYVYFNAPEPWNPNKYLDNTYVDNWGVTFKMPKGSYYYDPVAYPLENATVDDLNRHNWPSKVSEENVKRWSEEAKHLFEETDFAIIADATGWGIFEEAWGLRGFQRFLVDLYKNRVFVEALLDKILETQLSRFNAYLDAIGRYVDVVIVSDDLGMQTGPIIAPKMYREIIKPRHRELFKFIKTRTGAKLFLHTCGAIQPFISDLVDVGVEILNPIQVSAKGMDDTAAFKKEYGHDLVLWGGGCDTQDVLPHSTPRDVRNEVKRRIRDLAPGGGFVFAGVHNIQPDVPPENVVALYKAALEFGDYPIYTT